MTQEEYVSKLEPQVDPQVVLDVAKWPTETKLYIYLHSIQLADMARLEQMLTQFRFKLNHS